MLLEKICFSTIKAGKKVRNIVHLCLIWLKAFSTIGMAVSSQVIGLPILPTAALRMRSINSNANKLALE